MPKEANRWAAIVVCMVMAATFVCGALAEETAAVEPLKQGDQSEAVLKLKERLFDLGYFTTNDLNDKFNSETTKKLKRFQKDNGLEQTGVLDEATAALLYSEDVKGLYYDVERIVPIPEIDWPARDAEGYLDADGAFVHEDEDGGFWAYLTRNIQITILRREEPQIPLVWFETDIHVRNGEGFETVENNPERPGPKFDYPHNIARNNGYVLGFSDDFYGHRMYQKETVGVVIRNGEVLSHDTYRKRLRSLPNLDIMAQYPDGTLTVYECASITADELVAQGAVNVYCFGPILINDGEIDDIVLSGKYETKSPRQALGMYEPGHYLLLTVQGRRDDSEGTGLIRMARMLKARGVQESLNLDGGNTMALVFRGKMLNKLSTYKNRKFVRTVSSLIGLGHMEYTDVPEEED